MKKKIGSITADTSTGPENYVFPELAEDISSNLKIIKFPDGFTCYAPAEYGEASLIYNEIMINQEYFQYGLSAIGAHCVFDVGANIGIFTLAVKQKAPLATVYAFEPIEETFRILEKNVHLHECSATHVFNMAIGSTDHGEKIFTFYPHMPGNSTTTPEIKLAARPAFDQVFGKEQTDFLLQQEKRIAPVRTLSSIIQEQGVNNIDYLKIDVEGDELSVLEGIEDHQWSFIQQVAVETHTQQLRDQVREILIIHHYQVDENLGISAAMGVSNLYAKRL